MRNLCFLRLTQMAWLLSQESGAVDGTWAVTWVAQGHCKMGMAPSWDKAKSPREDSSPSVPVGHDTRLLRGSSFPCGTNPISPQTSISPLNFWSGKLKYTLASAAWKLPHSLHYTVLNSKSAHLQGNCAAGRKSFVRTLSLSFQKAFKVCSSF